MGRNPEDRSMSLRWEDSKRAKARCMCANVCVLVSLCVCVCVCVVKGRIQLMAGLDQCL